MDTANAIIRLVASVIGLVAAMLRFVPKAQDGDRQNKEKDR